MSYSDYYDSSIDYSMFTESSITGRYDHMSITEATQKFQVDVIDMLHEFTETVWITEATNAARGRRPFALLEGEGFWEKVKDMFRKAIAWIKDMYVKVKGWLLDKWEDAKKWWKTMGLSESDVKIGQDIYVNQVYDKPDVKVKVSSGAKESAELKGTDFAKDGDDAIGGLDVKIKPVNKDFMGEVMSLIVAQPIDTAHYAQYIINIAVKSLKVKPVKYKLVDGNQINDNEFQSSEYIKTEQGLKKAIDEMNLKVASMTSLDVYFQKVVYCGSDSEKYYVIDSGMLNDAVDCLFKNRNNFISRIMNHERACTKVLENTLRKAQKYQSGDTEYKNTHDNNLDDEFSYADKVELDIDQQYDHIGGDGHHYKGATLHGLKGVEKKSKITVDTLSTQIRFNSDIVKKAIEAYRRYLSNSIAIVKRVMSNEKIKKAINAIKEGEKPATAYSKLKESYDPYWDNDYSYGYGGMESYMWS